MQTQKIALITGGARGIGYACAEALTEDGARVVLADIEGAADAARSLGNEAIGITADLSDPDSIEGLLSIGEAPLDEQLDRTELATWTAIAQVILTMDETISKE